VQRGRHGSTAPGAIRPVQLHERHDASDFETRTQDQDWRCRKRPDGRTARTGETERRSWLALIPHVAALHASYSLHQTGRLPDGQNHFVFSEMVVQPPFAKNISASHPDPNHFYIDLVLSQERGVAHVTDAGRDAVDGGQPPRDEWWLTRTAKSCRSDAPMLGVKSAIGSAGDGVKQAWSPGRARSKP